MSKLFFTDLDGTLLNDDKLVGDATKRALAGFIDRGNHLALCSGRALYNVMLVYNTLLNLPGCYAIGYNGAGIYDIGRREEIYRRGVPLDLVRIFFALGKKHDIHCQTYSDELILTTKRSEALDYYNRYIDQKAVITDDVVSLLDKEPCKCLAIELHDHEKQERFRQ